MNKLLPTACVLLLITSFWLFFTRPKVDVLEEAINATYPDYASMERSFEEGYIAGQDSIDGNKIIEICASNGYYPTKYIYLEPTACDDSICKEAYDQGKTDAYLEVSTNCEL